MGRALGTNLTIMGQMAAYDAQGQAVKAQAKSAVTQMNYSLQNYEMQRRDAYEAAVEQIMSTRLQAQSLNAGVDVAVNERLGSGRTASLLKRSARGAEARRVSSIQGNYQQKSNEIDLNKEATLRSTKSYIGSLKMPSKLGLLLGVGSTLVDVNNARNNAKAEALSKGLDWDDFDYWFGSGSGIPPLKKQKPKPEKEGGN